MSEVPSIERKQQYWWDFLDSPPATHGDIDPVMHITDAELVQLRDRYRGGESLGTSILGLIPINPHFLQQQHEALGLADIPYGHATMEMLMKGDHVEERGSYLKPWYARQINTSSYIAKGSDGTYREESSQYKGSTVRGGRIDTPSVGAGRIHIGRASPGVSIEYITQSTLDGNGAMVSDAGTRIFQGTVSRPSWDELHEDENAYTTHFDVDDSSWATVPDGYAAAVTFISPHNEPDYDQLVANGAQTRLLLRHTEALPTPLLIR